MKAKLLKMYRKQFYDNLDFVGSWTVYAAKLLTVGGKPCIRFRTSDGHSFTFVEGEDIENADKEFNKF